MAMLCWLLVAALALASGAAAQAGELPEPFEGLSAVVRRGPAGAGRPDFLVPGIRGFTTIMLPEDAGPARLVMRMETSIQLMGPLEGAVESGLFLAETPATSLPVHAGAFPPGHPLHQVYTDPRLSTWPLAWYDRDKVLPSQWPGGVFWADARGLMHGTFQLAPGPEPGVQADSRLVFAPAGLPAATRPPVLDFAVLTDRRAPGDGPFCEQVAILSEADQAGEAWMELRVAALCLGASEPRVSGVLFRARLTHAHQRTWLVRGDVNADGLDDVLVARHQGNQLVFHLVASCRGCAPAGTPVEVDFGEALPVSAPAAATLPAPEEVTLCADPDSPQAGTATLRQVPHAALLDVDGDGDPDLLVSAYRDHGVAHLGYWVFANRAVGPLQDAPSQAALARGELFVLQASLAARPADTSGCLGLPGPMAGMLDRHFGPGAPPAEGTPPAHGPRLARHQVTFADHEPNPQVQNLSPFFATGEVMLYRPGPGPLDRPGLFTGARALNVGVRQRGQPFIPGNVGFRKDNWPLLASPVPLLALESRLMWGVLPGPGGPTAAALIHAEVLAPATGDNAGMVTLRLAINPLLGARSYGCDCSGRGTCALAGPEAGRCVCLAGFTGPTCGECAAGHYSRSCFRAATCDATTLPSTGAEGLGLCQCAEAYQEKPPARAFGDFRSCTLCAAGYFRPAGAPAGQCAACPAHCELCLDTSGQCVLCQPDAVMPPQSTECRGFASPAEAAAICGDGYFYNPQANACDTCPAGCSLCAGASRCTACANPDAALLDGMCVLDCPAGMWLRPAAPEDERPFNVCETCDEACKTCTGATAYHCLFCAPGYHRTMGLCELIPPMPDSSDSASSGPGPGQGSSSGSPGPGSSASGSHSSGPGPGSSDSFSTSGSPGTTPGAGGTNYMLIAGGAGGGLLLVIVVGLGVGFVAIRQRRRRGDASEHDAGSAGPGGPRGKGPARAGDPESGSPDLRDFSDSSSTLNSTSYLLGSPRSPALSAGSNDDISTGSGASSPGVDGEAGATAAAAARRPNMIDPSLPGFLHIDYDQAVEYSDDLPVLGVGGQAEVKAAHLRLEAFQTKTHLNNLDKIEFEGFGTTGRGLAAVKTVFVCDESRVAWDAFKQELITTWALSQAVHTVPLLAFTHSPPSIITPVYDTDLHTQLHCAGKALAGLAPERLAVPWHMALDVARQVASALASIHDLGFSHSDIKASNVFLQWIDRPQAETMRLKAKNRASRDTSLALSAGRGGFWRAVI
ncbi:hypothetical protein H696_02016 [Fonticula alba]|uniref:TKL protein kinase n=1 Tax=Fonticula alba TaxID=691883 RepID=A0A058ZAV3_FONAL|nr:hypothetical protein H696_02016 [Fonticula alba]KCV71066.1 hypothetical protein H696_02016 [Fonticula alba]|eukprot:XP_009494189.1 hypothetical protein H696_02016 [Fonticula alba]